MEEDSETATLPPPTKSTKSRGQQRKASAPTSKAKAANSKKQQSVDAVVDEGNQEEEQEKESEVIKPPTAPLGRAKRSNKKEKVEEPSLQAQPVVRLTRCAVPVSSSADSSSLPSSKRSSKRTTSNTAANLKDDDDDDEGQQKQPTPVAPKVKNTANFSFHPFCKMLKFCCRFRPRMSRQAAAEVGEEVLLPISIRMIASAVSSLLHRQ